ncbi:MAG: RNA methyltransferase [candidate division KSB1 bacterium]|nr:RNA methyltransferase [candidate division KSB1 bacterium]MDZ7318512.1 RNA methyltransferase [candidate division KSB1 bacterium]MDZ7341779.1 RNA methyltransferase [candidate division KSB1 bacterium]
MDQLEGKICVEAALNARQRKFNLIIIRSGIHPQQIESLLEQATEQHIPIKYATRSEIDTMAKGKTHGGILALATPRPITPIDQLLERLKSNRSAALLLLEGVDDSQNLGFTIRSAEALGFWAVLLKRHLWDFDGAAVSRASSGAFERMPIALFDQPEKVLARLKNLGFKILGCIANASRTIYEVDLLPPIILAIGGEKRGLSAAVRSHCDRFVKIPMLVDIGSLSLSHAASIVMAECARQRLLRNEPATPAP